MASVRPKTIASGGISPKGWASVLTLLVVIAGFYQTGGKSLSCTLRAKAFMVSGRDSNLIYVVEE
jgi:hypothetical protein